MKTNTLLIPVSGYPFSKFDIVLNNLNYTMKFNYNFRFQFWTFSLIRSNIVLLDNVKILQGFNIGSQFHNVDLGGVFFVKSLSGDLSDPTFDDFASDKDKQFFYQYEVN